jgi:internalin A
LLDLPALKELSIADNPLLSPPPEIAASGTDSVVKARRAGASRQWASKLLVVDEGGVGKTSLIKALLGRAHDPSEPTTHAIKLSDVSLPHPELDDVGMRLSTWDFGGQEIYHATHQFFLTDRSLFLLLWNARLGWEQGKLQYWLDIIKSRAPESPVLLVATHADASQRPVDLPLDDLRREYPQVAGNLIIDNETRTGVEGLRAELARRAADLPLMGAEWPTTWLKAAEAVKGTPDKHITPNQMWQLMAGAGVADPVQQRYIAVAMHALGDILYYSDDPELEQTVVLRPEWVNEYISLVLDSKPVDEARGLLSQAEMTRLWSSLDRGMRDHFLGMMDKYGISFRVDGAGTGVVSLVVERLPWNPPPFEDEWRQLAEVPGTQEIRVCYQLNTTPPGIPTWFIARSHRFTTTTHWRTGALLAHPDGAHKALLRAQPRRNTVELTVRGPNPAAFFSILDDGFNQTLERYRGLEINRLIPCPCASGRTEQFDYGDLQRRLAMNPPRHDIECHRSGELINVPKLLYGLAPSERDSNRAGIERLTAMLNELVNGMTDQAEKIDGLTASMASQAEYLQRTFLKLTRLIQDSQEVRCPSVFTVVPVKTSVTGAHYEIRLYCEEPGAVHPLASNDGRYPVTEPAEWLRKVRPHLRQLLTVLKHAAPLAGPVLGMAVGHLSDRLSAELDTMTEIVDQIPEFPRDLDPPEKDVRSDSGRVERASNEADFRALEGLLLKLDPDRRWGGLSRTVTPEGPTLYLCRDHADAYRRAVRLWRISIFVEPPQGPLLLLAAASRGRRGRDAGRIGWTSAVQPGR